MTVVQCHGTFNILHYGHLIYLQFARTLGDVLIVTVTAKEFVHRPGVHILEDHQRIAMLRALAVVDDVKLIYAPGAEEAIRKVKPDYYVKGREYEGRLPEHRLVESYGGKVVFHYDEEASPIKSTQMLKYIKEQHARESAGSDQ
jgi:cytidyltransferase-like protein